MKIIIAIGAISLFTACNNSSRDTTTTTDSMGVYDSITKANHDTTGIKGNEMPMVDPDDTSFVAKAAMGGQMEVDLANMANQKASSQRVKDFADMMIRDHTAANTELNRLGGSMYSTRPMTSKAESMRDKLSKLDGKNFDKAYMDHMVSDHKEDISLFEKASKNAKGQDLKDFASRTLPTLKVHLDSAQAVQKSLR